jgi:zinc protease
MASKRTLLNTAVTVILLAVAAPAFAQLHPKDLPAPAPLKFQPPKPVEFTLGNGIHVFYMEDRELPTVNIIGYLKAGSIYEPAEKTGLASMTGQVLRTGGTKTMTGDAMDQELEFLAASVTSGIGSEYATVSAQCMKKDTKRVTEIFADVLMNPEFRQDKVDLAKNQANESIRRRWDMPIQAASILFSEKAYGADNPLGRRMTPRSLAAVSRQDLIEFHQKYFAPNNLNIGIVGDLSSAEARELLQTAFASWTKKDILFPEVPALVEKADGTVYYAYKDTPQANVYIGHLGVRRGNPDEFKIQTMNYILGGGTFSARLMKELRSNRGLTYGIYGGVEFGRDRGLFGRDKGLFAISSQLKAERFIEALALIKSLIKDMQDRPVTDAEIAEARNSAINSFVFNFEQKRSALTQYMLLKLNGYPDTFLDTYIDNVRKVTKEDIQAAAKKYMDAEKMTILVVGDEKRFDKPLASFGKVRELDLKKIMEEERPPQK